MREEVYKIFCEAGDGIFSRIRDGIDVELKDDEKTKLIQYAQKIKKDLNETHVSRDDFDFILDFLFYCRIYSDSVDWMDELIIDFYEALGY